MSQSVTQPWVQGISLMQQTAQRVGQPARMLVCMDCAMQEKAPVAFMLELGTNG